ncbi:gamma-crystallin M2-like [Notothenia coriiceps]|uniref:Gamma-crystallin M2-like n=1 Tax=Notothenia coriiceps TaxID=8208 RepID=A0A6I9P8X3_9TELE|nr:PREDICTED: gamma-crystallin M2-like [Notothenia coriiceps]
MTSSGMNMNSKITFYEEKNFQGRSYECMSDCSDMSSYLNRCHSCRVEKGCFMVYDRTNYMGNQYFMRRGEYADYMSMMGMSDCIKSCRMIKCFRNVQLQWSLANVMEGNWLMYEPGPFRGRMMYMDLNSPITSDSFSSFSITDNNSARVLRVSLSTFVLTGFFPEFVAVGSLVKKKQSRELRRLVTPDTQEVSNGEWMWQ